MTRPISVSNIAWETADDAAIAGLLSARGVRLIDVAPGKYFPDPAQASDTQIAQVRQWWADRGITIYGMQALLFGTSGLNLFGDADVQQRMLDRLDQVCRVAAGLGVKFLVFGSPKNRDRSGLSDEQTQAMALDFFTRLGNVAVARGVCVCLEPNPAAYGCNFMTHTDDAARMVALVDHPGIRMQLDAGTIAMNGEDAAQVIARHACRVGHIHASEPNLVPLGEGGTDHAVIGRLLAQHLPDKPVAIEMVAARDRPAVQVVGAAIDLMFARYGAPAGGTQP